MGLRCTAGTFFCENVIWPGAKGVSGKVIAASGWFFGAFVGCKSNYRELQNVGD